MSPSPFGVLESGAAFRDLPDPSAWGPTLYRGQTHFGNDRDDVLQVPRCNKFDPFLFGTGHVERLPGRLADGRRNLNHAARVRAQSLLLDRAVLRRRSALETPDAQLTASVSLAARHQASYESSFPLLSGSASNPQLLRG